MAERATSQRSTHPVLFLILFLPMGISNGYVVVTLAYLLSQAHIAVGELATLAALSLLPQTFKFLGGPIVDTTLNNKIWYALSATATGLLMTATAVIPATRSNMMLIDVLVFAFSTASAFNALAADSLMAHATAPEEKGRAGGWSQAGNLGGSGLGGGGALWLAQNVAAGWVAGAAIGAVCILSCLALLFAREPEAEHRVEHFLGSLWNVAKDVWELICSRRGLLAVVAMSLPIAAGAMSNLWSAVAGDWHASANAVALVNGALNGVVSMVGCIIGGWICDKMSRMVAFNLFSLVLSASALVMAFAPRTQDMYVAFVLIYSFINGFGFAAWGAVVLEAIGKGAAATKYNILASLANWPIIYLTKIDGWARTWQPPAWIPWHGSTLMLVAEAVVPVAGTLVLVLFALVTKPLYRSSR
ncbi:MAG: MFS transporter [Alphaproteobacteria bacterium]|nr:MFS transporter [Alphaproteobacteria bacterium]